MFEKATEAAMRHGSIGRQARGYFGWEMVTATGWAVALAVMLLGSTYHRLGRPAIDWTLAADASKPVVLGSDRR